MEIYWSLLSILLQTCISLASDSGEVRNKRMVNGSFVSNNQFPYVAKVIINGVNCSGVILDKVFVATGRQCIGDFRNRNTTSHSAEVYAGFKNLRYTSDYKHEGVQKSRIITAYCYSEDNKENQLRDDLCLLKVFPRFTWTKTVNVANLPETYRWPVREEKSCVLASYGKGFDGDEIGSLRATNLSVKHPSICASLNKSRHLDRLLCSKAAPCTGDAGAPLVCGRYVVAILQGNDKEVCGETVDEVAFVYLPRYSQFIETVLWSEPARFRVRVRSSAVSYLKNSTRVYILIFIMFILGKQF